MAHYTITTMLSLPTLRAPLKTTNSNNNYNLTFKKHPVEAGEVEEVGEGEGCAENLLGDPGGRQVVPGEGEDPVEGREAKGGKQSRVDLVPQTSHLPEILLLPGLESSPNFT